MTERVKFEAWLFGEHTLPNQSIPYAAEEVMFELWQKLKACAEQKDKEIAELRKDVDFWNTSSAEWKLAYASLGGTASESATEELSAIKAAEYQRGFDTGVCSNTDAAVYAMGKQAGRAELGKELMDQDPLSAEKWVAVLNKQPEPRFYSGSDLSEPFTE